MKPVEFRRQVFRDASHWKHGLSYRLQTVETGGFALFSRPSFTKWVIQADEAQFITSIAVDHSGRVFWIHRENCQLYRYDPIGNLIEPMVPLADCDENGSHTFGRMIHVKGRLWILDRSGSRLLSLRTDTFQIIAEISLRDPIDIAWSSGRLFALDRDGISIYDVNGTMLSPPRGEHLWQPVAMSAAPCGKWIYVVDTCFRGFRRFNIDGTFQDEIGTFCDVRFDFAPTLLAVDSGENLFVSDGSQMAHEFAPDGSYIGDTGDLNPLSQIRGMTFSPCGDLYVSSPEGIARFGSNTGLAGNEGVFYSGTLDSGGDGLECWHRIDLVANIETGGVLEVFYATSDKQDIVSSVNGIIVREGPAFEKVTDLETQLGDHWKGPEQLRAFSPVEAAEDAASQSSFSERSTHSMLFRSDTKRYLWLKLQLSALAPEAKVSISGMRVYYPRLSYLRYLPAVYQENPTSREFLERFLSIFETVLGDLEATIERIPEIFDPQSTPKEFLDWLAQWLDLGIEEEWSPAVKRSLIRKAASLYQRKGRPDALAEFIEIVTQRRPFIRESFDIERPFILGTTNLGLETRVFHQPTENLPRDQRTVLGCSSILGTSRISTTTQKPVNPFRAAAHHFTVLLDLSPRDFQRYERSLHRIIRENSPAHVGYDIRLVSGVGLGPDMALGINFRVQDPEPLYLGHSSLGRSILSRFSYGPELGIDALVAGAACGSDDAASSYGEQ